MILYNKICDELPKSKVLSQIWLNNGTGLVLPVLKGYFSLGSSIERHKNLVFRESFDYLDDEETDGSLHK